MREIPLSKGYVALCDDEDYEELCCYHWRADVRDGGACIFAVRSLCHGSAQRVYMHRQVMNAPGNVEVMHIDGNRLNNQKDNLMLVQRVGRIKKASRYRGVSWDGRINRWRAVITFKGARELLGSFDTEDEAALAWNQRAIQAWGDAAILNEIEASDA